MCDPRNSQGLRANGHLKVAQMQAQSGWDRPDPCCNLIKRKPPGLVCFREGFGVRFSTAAKTLSLGVTHSPISWRLKHTSDWVRGMLR